VTWRTVDVNTSGLGFGLVARLSDSGRWGVGLIGEMSVPGALVAVISSCLELLGVDSGTWLAVVLAFISMIPENGGLSVLNRINMAYLKCCQSFLNQHAYRIVCEE
jgi:hypothetical protein